MTGVLANLLTGNATPPNTLSPHPVRVYTAILNKLPHFYSVTGKLVYCALCELHKYLTGFGKIAWQACF